MNIPWPLRDLLRHPGVYLVGGAVRDWMLGRPVNDYDIVVEADPLSFAREVGFRLGLRPFQLGKDQTVNFRIVDGDRVYDFSQLRGRTLEDDLKKRDFTINAMGYDVAAHKVIDPLDGRQDLHLKCVRLVSKNAVTSDPLRMLRAFRFAAVLGFRIASQTMRWIDREARRITESAPERICGELSYLLAVNPSAPYVRQAVETGLLLRIIPELKVCSGCRLHSIHRDGLQHAMAAYQAMEEVLSRYPEFWPDVAPFIERYLEKTDGHVLLKWVSLLHDVGKPATKPADAVKPVQSLAHEVEGARIAGDIARRLRMPGWHEDYISRMVAGHLHFFQLFAAQENDALSSRMMVRFMMKYGDDVVALVMHALADQSAKVASPPALRGKLIRFGRRVLLKYLNDVKPKMNAPRLVTGYDLMQRFRLKPSKLIGNLLGRIEEARLDGRIRTKGEGLELAGEILKMEGDAGIEPATPSSGGLCSIR